MKKRKIAGPAGDINIITGTSKRLDSQMIHLSGNDRIEGEHEQPCSNFIDDVILSYEIVERTFLITNAILSKANLGDANDSPFWNRATRTKV
jgi:hypothetical protein